jgi:hypothetical protein
MDKNILPLDAFVLALFESKMLLTSTTGNDSENKCLILKTIEFRLDFRLGCRSDLD